MLEKRRSTFPLKAMLADTGLKNYVVEFARALRASDSIHPLVLAIPSPRYWIGLAFSLVNGANPAPEVGEDEIDTASVYVADFLRSFGEIGIDAVMLEESLGEEPKSSDELGWYQPVLNLAAHYRWDIGLRMPSTAFDLKIEEGVDFVIAPDGMSVHTKGVALADAFLRGEAPPGIPAGSFYYVRIPQDAKPEQVLERLALLR